MWQRLKFTSEKPRNNKRNFETNGRKHGKKLSSICTNPSKSHFEVKSFTQRSARTKTSLAQKKSVEMAILLTFTIRPKRRLNK